MHSVVRTRNSEEALIRDDRRALHLNCGKCSRIPDEKGTTLLLALVFLLVVSLIVVSMVDLAGNNLSATVKFKSAHAAETSANSAAEVAVNYSRHHFVKGTLSVSPQACWTGTPSQLSLAETIGASSITTSVDVWCSTILAPLSTNSTRVMTVSVCLHSLSLTNVQCAAGPLLQAVVSFDDYPNVFGPDTCNATLDGVQIASPNTCGTAMTINEWVFRPAPPTITSITKTAVLGCLSLIQVTIVGTGFVSGSTQVYFNVTNGSISATNVTVSPGSTTQLTACAPPETAGTAAQVVVTTPVGTSNPFAFTF